MYLTQSWHHIQGRKKRREKPGFHKQVFIFHKHLFMTTLALYPQFSRIGLGVLQYQLDRHNIKEESQLLFTKITKHWVYQSDLVA